MRKCANCGLERERAEYSKSQWGRGTGLTSRCKVCVAAGNEPPTHGSVAATDAGDHASKPAGLRADDDSALALSSGYALSLTLTPTL